mgnify:CR=1 FL=1
MNAGQLAEVISFIIFLTRLTRILENNFSGYFNGCRVTYKWMMNGDRLATAWNSFSNPTCVDGESGNRPVDFMY